MGRKIPDRLLTGFVLIDRQHQDIYDRIDDLSRLLDKGASREQLLEVMDYLEKYTVVHFDFEESAMRMYEYPDRVEHMAAHLVLRENVRIVRADVDRQGATPELLQRCRELLAEALFRHIAEHDLRLAPFLKEKNPGGWVL